MWKQCYTLYLSDKTSPDRSTNTFSEVELSKTNNEIANGAIYQCSNQASKNLAFSHKRKIKKAHRSRRFRAVEAKDKKCQYCGSLFQQKHLNLHQQKCYVYEKFIDNKECKICNHVSTNMISAKMHFGKWHKTERFGLMLCIFRQKNGPAARKIFC